MADDVKLAKYVLQHGSLDEKIKSVINDSLSKYLFESNNTITRGKMVRDVEVHLTELEEEIGIEFNVTSEERVNELVYHIHYLDKKISFTAQL